MPHLLITHSRGVTPYYLSHFLSLYVLSRFLRSISANILTVPRACFQLSCRPCFCDNSEIPWTIPLVTHKPFVHLNNISKRIPPRLPLTLLHEYSLASTCFKCVLIVFFLTSALYKLRAYSLTYLLTISSWKSIRHLFTSCGLCIIFAPPCIMRVILYFFYWFYRRFIKTVNC